MAAHTPDLTNAMHEPEIDAEELAALLDGRLTGERRTALLTRLAASEELTSIYADAVAASQSETSARVLRGPERWFARIGTPRLAALAASLLVIVAASFWYQARREGAADPTAATVAWLSEPGAGLDAGWNERAWSVTRGAPSSLTPSARAARVGALSVDLELAVRSGNPAVPALAREIVALLQDVPASAPAVLLYEDLAGRADASGAAVQEAHRRARRAAIAVLDRGGFASGAWAEGALVAARRRDVQYFADSRLSVPKGTLAPEVSSLIERIREARVEPVDWETVARLARELLAAIGG